MCDAKPLVSIHSSTFSLERESVSVTFVPLWGLYEVGIGLSYRPASQCGLATQFQTRFLESIPRPIVGSDLLTKLSAGYLRTLISDTGWIIRQKEKKQRVKTVLLYNGGSCNVFTLKRCITFRSITKPTTLLKGTQAWEFFGLWFWNLYFFVVSYA
jgi:hypothetical protein